MPESIYFLVSASESVSVSESESVSVSASVLLCLVSDFCVSVFVSLQLCD